MLISNHLILSFFIFCKVATNHGQHHPQIEPCRIGDVVKNECNKCLCTSKTVFDCLSINCSIASKQPEDSSEQTCLPNQLYVKNTISCICTEHGRWPHQQCYNTFQSLPPSNIERHKCEPNTYTTIDCNVCRCGHDGEFVSHQCTRNVCEDDLYNTSRKSNMDTQLSNNSIYSVCELNNWYSLKPCQLCYCIKQNQLTCNYVRSSNHSIDSGTNTLQMCSENIITEILELAKENRRSILYLLSARDNFDPFKNRTNRRNYVEKMSILIKIGNNSDVIINNISSKSILDSNTGDHLHSDIIKQNTSENITYIRSLTTATNISSNIGKTENILEVEVPKEMINNIIDMALRKSMISLTDRTACVPGTTIMKECNTCHCMKNGKLLCTVNKCD